MDSPRLPINPGSEAEATPVIWFAVYLPEEKIAAGEEGQHVILGGNPRIILRPAR